MKRWIAGLTAGLMMAGGSLYIHAQQAPKVESKLIVIEGAAHGFRGKDARRAQNALVGWFEKHLLKNEK